MIGGDIGLVVLLLAAGHDVALVHHGLVHEQYGQYHPHHAQRVGGGIAHRHRLVERAGGLATQGLDERLLGSTQPGRVGHTTREYAHDLVGLHVACAVVYGQGYNDVEPYDGQCQAIEQQAAFLERREKRGAHLQSYREDKQNESEFLYKLEDVGVDHGAEVAHRKTHKEYED